MLSRGEAFAPKGATDPWPPDGPLRRCATGANPIGLVLFLAGDREMSTAPHQRPQRPP
jgi:hypothetical protein